MSTTGEADFGQVPFEGFCMQCAVEGVRAGEFYACPSCGSILVKAAGVEIDPVPEQTPEPPEAQ
jgi:hypothetical protein